MPDGSVALVTGAGGGIGGAIARHLSRAGYTVAACDLNRAAAKDVVAGLDGPGGAYAVDVSDSAERRSRPLPTSSVSSARSGCW